MINATETLTVGATLSGSLEKSEDADWIKVVLAANTFYTFSHVTSPGVSPPVQLVKADGSETKFAGLMGETPGYLQVHVPAAGEYFIKVLGATGANGPYSITWQPTIILDDFGDTPDTAGRMEIGVKVSGEWIAIELTAGKTYWMTLTPGVPFSGGSAKGRILDGDGNVIVQSDWDLVPMTLAVTPKVSGTYYYEVAANGPVGSYQLSSAVGIPDDAGDRMADAVLLTNGNSHKGVLEIQKDVDYFKLDATPGLRYAVAAARQPLSWENFRYSFLMQRGILYHHRPRKGCGRKPIMSSTTMCRSATPRYSTTVMPRVPRTPSGRLKYRALTRVRPVPQDRSP